MWARIVAVVAGVWLMVSPAVYGYVDAPAEVSDRIVGPVGAALSFVAIWGICRALRWSTLPLGAWLVFGPWFLDFPLEASLNSVAVGLVFILTAPVRGTVEDQLGGSWSSLTEPRPGRTEGVSAPD